MKYGSSEKYLKTLHLKLTIKLKMIIMRVQWKYPSMSMINIRFKLNTLKTVQVAAMFLKLHGGSMKYLGLLKLMYMADRLAFKNIDQPISGDNYVSMNKGPVLSTVYDFIKANKRHKGNTIWEKYISTRNQSSNHEVKLLEDPGIDELSDEEEEIINTIYEKWGKQDRFELVDLTHEFPEWKFPDGSSIKIKIVDILRSIGKTQEEIEYIGEIAAREMYLDNLLNE